MAWIKQSDVNRRSSVDDSPVHVQQNTMDDIDNTIF